ncbi:MAG: RNA polymerase sigma factor [Eubacteriales bacterium]
MKDLYEKYKLDVYKYLYSLTRDKLLAEDLTSETFLAVLKSLHTFKGNSSVKTWIFGIARNKWLEKENVSCTFVYIYNCLYHKCCMDVYR